MPIDIFGVSATVAVSSETRNVARYKAIAFALVVILKDEQWAIRCNDNLMLSEISQSQVLWSHHARTLVAFF
ncbi:hypothetical protein L6452_14823 [Arctium lappa]|uniref:Uncharacterized protein n=1 Tax=Arctium lappa TaxID=4217 RepID=A0ACB9CM59_ARCLA|nr:hypothetical protein L6452_14823 [Arctium lappa]